MTNPWKVAQAKEISDMVKTKPVVGVVTMRGLPAKQLQKMRSSLPAELFMAKKNLLIKGLEDAKLKGLTEHVGDQPALLLSEENPFKLYKQISDGRMSAPAKGGDLAPEDILVKKGETPFPAGPVLGDLKGVGIPCKIEGGKIVITEDKIVVKEGEAIEAKLAEMLAKLGIEPMEIGLDLLAASEKGEIFLKDLLAIDEDKYLADMQSAFQRAFKLSMGVAYPTKNNIEMLLQNAFNNSKAISIETGIVTKATVSDLLAKANAQAASLKSAAPEKAAEAPKTEEKPTEEAKPEEEKKEEAPAEEAKPEESAEAKPEAPVEEPKAEEPEKVEEVKAEPEEKKEEPKAEEAPAEPAEEKPAEEKKE